MVIKINGKFILLLVTGAAMATSVFLAAKKTPEAQQKKEEALKEKREKTGDPNAQLTFVESVKAQIGSYAPAIVSGAIALGTLTGSEVINKKTFDKAKKSLNDFQDMTKQLGGEGAVKTIQKAIDQRKIDEKDGKEWESTETFRIVFQGKSIQFESTREKVIQAIYEANRYFHGKGIITFNEFLSLLKQPSVGKEGDIRGWEAYTGESIYGYSWIDFGMKECIDEPWITEIFMAVYPHFFEEDDCKNELEYGGVMKLNGTEEAT